MMRVRLLSRNGAASFQWNSIVPRSKVGIDETNFLALLAPDQRPKREIPSRDPV